MTKSRLAWLLLPVWLLTNAVTSATAQSTYTETVLHNFAIIAPNGSDPWAGVVRDGAGNLYGTTESGGEWDAGTVYKIDTTGRETVLHSFTSGTDGGKPKAGVILDAAGNLYGTTTQAGSFQGTGCSTYGCGVVYRLDPSGHETVLYSFPGGAYGSGPGSRLARDSAGNLYGTAGGGASGYGVIFKLDTAGHETILHNFAGGDDGEYPNEVTLDAAGGLYGTTYEGGASNLGVVFKLAPSGALTVLHSFSGADGDLPYAGVILDAYGNIYGTTYGGGPNNYGVVFKLDTAGNETVLWNFTGGQDGGSPRADLLRDSAGNLYGTTQCGGAAIQGYYCGDGVVFKLDRSGHQSVLYRFTGGADGAQPFSTLIADQEGNLYGTTSAGASGTGGYGAVFQLNKAGQESTVYTFPQEVDASKPDASVFRDAAGNLYGTTTLAGTFNDGALYRIDMSGGETVLYSFGGANASNGCQPYGGVAGDAAGNLYGTTKYCGTLAGGFTYGTLYKMDPAGNLTVLHNFGATGDGAYPAGGVTLDAAGNIYGTTFSGGAYCQTGDCAGVVYKLDAGGNYSILYSFTTASGWYQPEGTLALDSAGNIYGTTTTGGAFRLDPAGNFTPIHVFTGGAGGFDLVAGVVLDAAGNIYGTAYQGGTGTCKDLTGCGVVFKLDSSGNETVLHTFTGGPDGGSPLGGVVLDSAGNLYGTTQYGGSAYGSAGHGVVFKLDPSGHETVIHTFTGKPDGGTPGAGVILDQSGNIYGTTYAGGAVNRGTVFKLKLQ